jgi:hypothetical protein
VLGKQKRRRKQAERLRQYVAELVGYPAEPGAVLAWGRGVLHEIDPVIGPHATDAVFVATEKAIYYQFLEETPRELLSMRAIATGVGPSEWKTLARESTSALVFEDFVDVDARQAVDGRWDVFMLPRSATSGFDLKGFGFVEAFGGEPLERIAAHIRSLPNHRAVSDGRVKLKTSIPTMWLFGAMVPV